MRFKLLIGAAAFIFVGWIAWWWIGASTIEARFANWVEEQAEDGVIITYSEQSLLGFPNRFDLFLTGLRIEDTRRGRVTEFDQIALMALAYAPQSWIAAAEGEIVFETPEMRHVLTGDVLRASATLRRGQEIERAQLELRQGLLRNQDGVERRIETLDMALSPVQEPRSYRIGLSIDGIMRVGQEEEEPMAVRQLYLDAHITFSSPLTAAVLQRPDVDALTIEDAWAEAPALRIEGTGALTADSAGYARGQVDVSLRNWQETLNAARQNDVLTEQQAEGLRLVLTLMGGGADGAVTVPVRFDTASTMIGFFTLGPAPRLRRE